MKSKEILGVDIGGVIIDRVNDKIDTSFYGDNYLQTTAVAGVFESLRRLVDERFGTRVWLVSKCNQSIEKKVLHWLDYHNFYDQTGILRNHVRFCRERHEKTGICKELKITHFIDDRLEVLSYLATVKNLYLFRPRPDEVRQFAGFLDRVCQVNTWQELLLELLFTRRRKQKEN